jgi:Sec-independent protein translocase protein TatA
MKQKYLIIIIIIIILFDNKKLSGIPKAALRADLVGNQSIIQNDMNKFAE